MNDITDKGDIIHNINSAISAVQSALYVISENWNRDSALMQKIVPMTIHRMDDLLIEWEKLKTMESIKR